MSLYKDTNGNIHDDMEGTALCLLPAGCVLISDAEAEIILNPPPSPESIAKEKDEIIAKARIIREQILNRLSGILLSYVAAGDTSHNAAIETGRQRLLNMTKDPRVVAATDGDSTKTAVMAVYGEIASALAAADQASVSAFNGISL